MCTPALREIKRINPRCRIRFYSNYTDLLDGLPFIDEALPIRLMPNNAVYMDYEKDVPSKSHLAALMGKNLGISVKQVKPECIVHREIVNHYREAWHSFPRPYLLIQRSASAWTPNKDWPEEHWNRLIVSVLAAGATIIECGTADARGKPVIADAYIDLRGKTNLAELAAAIAACDVFVGPVSGPVHIAAAVGTAAVVILGGYEHPNNTAYEGNIVLSTDMSCSPCWLKTPCPYDLACLNKISPHEVEQAVWKLWRRMKSFQNG